MTVDDVFDQYAREAGRIYDQRTAGDFTWTGLLAAFLTDIKTAEEA